MNLHEKTLKRIDEIKSIKTLDLIEFITKELTKHMLNITLSQIKKDKELEYTNVRICISNSDLVDLLTLMPHNDKSIMWYEICKTLGFKSKSVFYSYDNEFLQWDISDTLYLGKHNEN